MPRSGTLVICVQNLDFSGANQVVLNIVMGRMHESNVVVLSPKIGTFAARFVESGAAVRVGVLQDLLNEIRDVFCIICNTIMTADIVVEMSDRPHPVIWILHEWWDDEMIRENLRIRNYQGLTLSTVKLALAKADRVVCVCESQRRLYNPTAPSSVIFVGVPDPLPRQLAAAMPVARATSVSANSLTTAGTTAASVASQGCPAFLPLGVHVASSSPANSCCLAPTPTPTPAIVSNATSSNNTSSQAGSPGPQGVSASITTVAIPESIPLAAPISIGPVGGGSRDKPFTFLCLGIVCPRKNQLWTVQLFKQFCQQHSLSVHDVRLQIVGARYTRVYEIEYLERVKREIAGTREGDSHVGDDEERDFSDMIELYDVTDDVEHFYREADCLILTSLNEVTPMVISESFSWSLPVISTNIAGIKEMFVNGIEGYHFDPWDTTSALNALHSLYTNDLLREQMAVAARRRFESCFDVNHMVEDYRRLVLEVAPPVILVDMDGALIDWDKGFYQEWSRKGYDKMCSIDRSLSYFMEKCIVPGSNKEQVSGGKGSVNWEKEAESIFLAKGFFEGLKAMEGALEAIQEMDASGLFKVYICTAPILHSQYCAQEKLNWIRTHLGESWLSKVILCADKTMVAGDLLIDDKPYEYLSPGGKHTTATWKQIIFDAPYNRQKRLPRMFRWRDWKSYVYPLLGKECPPEIFALSLEEFDGSYLHSTDAAVLGPTPTTTPLVPPIHPATKAVPVVASTTSMAQSLPNLPPKPPSLSICKIRQALTSAHALHSGKSAEEVQKDHDLLQPHSGAATPLNPEEVASIVSGSASLLGEDGVGTGNGGSSEEERDEHHYQRIQQEYEVPSIGVGKLQKQQEQRQEKKKALHNRMRERNEQYKANKESAERHLALHHSDEVEGEGLQIFRKAYQHWAGEKVSTPVKCSTPLPPHERSGSSAIGPSGGSGTRTHKRNSKV